MPFREESPEVLYDESEFVAFGTQRVAMLVDRASASPNRRSRICAHRTPDDSIHEMIICLLADGYVQPHSHNRPESLHVIEGAADLVIFDQTGEVQGKMAIGVEASELRFVRLPPHCMHTLIVRSKFLIFHETTSGPFRRDDTTFAKWAPAESDSTKIEPYVKQLESQLRDISDSSQEES